MAADVTTSEWTFALPEHPVGGISLLYGEASLGNGFLGPDPAANVSSFLAEGPDWPERLRFAAIARLPLLVPEVIRPVVSHLTSEGGKALGVLCNFPHEPVFSHIIARLLETWTPPARLCVAIVNEFLGVLSENARQVTIMDRIMIDAPVAAIRVLAQGTVPLPRSERAKVLFALAVRLLPKNIDTKIAPTPSGRLDPAVEEGLLDRAVQAAHLDRHFLIAKDAGLASLAWDNVSQPTPCQNIATSLVDEPVRRWLAVHLLARLASSIC